MTSFLRHSLSLGAEIKHLYTLTEKPIVTLCNPSVCVHNDEVITNIRGVNYFLWSDEYNRFNSACGPYCYIADKDSGAWKQISENYIGRHNGGFQKIDSESPDRWSFIGVEDIRLVSWNNTLYSIAGRRDYWENGEGRVVMAEVGLDGTYKNEIVLEYPNSNFCEKNWVPIEDMPYHFVRWVNPLQILRADRETGHCELVLEKEFPPHEYKNYCDMQMRGSTQVIRVDDYYMTIIHLCHLEINEKDEKCNVEYPHQLLVWDNEWNFKYLSKPFTFADFKVEFTNGMCYKDGVFHVGFALQDNMAFTLSVDKEVFKAFFEGNISNNEISGNNILEFFNDTTNSSSCMRFGYDMLNACDYSAAAACFKRACEYNTFNDKNLLYDSLLMCGKILAKIHNCESHEESIYLRMVDLLPDISDGYYMVALYHYWRGHHRLSYSFAKIAYEKNNWRNINAIDNELILLYSLYFTEDYLMVRGLLECIKSRCNEEQLNIVKDFIEYIDNNQKNITRIL